MELRSAGCGAFFVDPRFAWINAGLAQLLYEVGFSTAHFFEGYTGLTISVLVITTLFLLMQLTARLSWTQVFARAWPNGRPDSC